MSIILDRVQPIRWRGSRRKRTRLWKRRPLERGHRRGWRGRRGGRERGPGFERRTLRRVRPRGRWKIDPGEESEPAAATNFDNPGDVLRRRWRRRQRRRRWKRSSGLAAVHPTVRVGQKYRQVVRVFQQIGWPRCLVPSFFCVSLKPKHGPFHLEMHLYQCCAC